MPKTNRKNRTRQANRPPKDEEARQNYLKNNVKKK
mgnify:CR=1 FL=1